MRSGAPTPHHRRGWALLAFGATALGLTLGACSSTDTADAPRGDCPVEPVSVVATVNQWGQIVEQLGGDCVTVDSIISGSAADPHDYEPTPADSAAFEDADLAVLNGLGYDSWAQRALDQVGDGPAVIVAGDVAGRTTGDNPHIWYSPEAVRAMTEAITGELAQLTPLGPDAGGYLGERFDAWMESLQSYDDAIDGRDVLKALDYKAKLAPKRYDHRLGEAQARLARLTRSKAMRDRSIILVFEGMDAAGKGRAVSNRCAAGCGAGAATWG